MIYNSEKHLLISLLAVLWLAPDATAQDSARYVVRVSPFMSLDALGPPRIATHPMTPANVIFTNSHWLARTSSGTGSTVRFTTDHAFQHVIDSSYKRDARLTITRIIGTASAGWTIDTVTDTTNYASGDEAATVQVSSRRPGLATITMSATFITGTVSTLKSGQYQMTVVGTISEN